MGNLLRNVLLIVGAVAGLFMLDLMKNKLKEHDVNKKIQKALKDVVHRRTGCGEGNDSSSTE